MNPKTRAEIVNKITWVQPDEWPPVGGYITDGDAVDKEFFGADCKRISTGQELIPSLPVRLSVTGRKVTRCPYTDQNQVRVKIEFFGDDGEAFIKDVTFGRAVFE